MVDTDPDRDVTAGSPRRQGSISTEELVNLYDNVAPKETTAEPVLQVEVPNGCSGDERVVDISCSKDNTEDQDVAISPDYTMEQQSVSSADHQTQVESSVVAVEQYAIENNQLPTSDINEFRGNPDYAQPTESSGRGLPTFGDFDIGSRMLPDDEILAQQTFRDVASNYFVIRNLPSNMPNATLSFGYEDQQHPPVQPEGVIDVVNYYRPPVQPDYDEQRYDQIPRGHKSKRAGSIISNTGGDTTASSYGRATDNEESPRVFSNTSTPSSEMRNDDYRPRRKAPVIDDASEYTAESPDATTKSGLFEVPVKVCALPRIIDPFKGFSKVCTPRAIKMLHFVRNGTRTQCSIEKNAATLLQTHIKDLKVVCISICGDARTGKSYLASMLVNKPVNSFQCAEPYAPSHIMNQFNPPAEGTVWAYVGVYQEKYAYIYLDFTGFENNQEDRIQMTQFAMLLSNCVICSIANPPRMGIYDAVKAMINVTDNMQHNNESDMLQMNQTIEDFRRKATLDRDKSKTFDLKETPTDDANEERIEQSKTDIWKAPIIYFVFRDSDGHVKCLDERIFTPETLVEQGIFDHYTNIFNYNRKEGVFDFRNRMLDAFEVFLNRKYTTLPCPVTQESNPLKTQMSPAANAANALKRMFATLLAPANANIMLTDISECTPTSLLTEEMTSGQPCMTAIPNHMLNPRFCEKLDEVKVCIYHDTLAHTQSEMQLNGQMFANYLMLLVNHYNNKGYVTVKDATNILEEVLSKQNEEVSKAVMVHFFKGLKDHVVMQLPMEPRILLSKCMKLKLKSLQKFQTQAIGTQAHYAEQYANLEKSLDNLIAKLETRNDKIAIDTATAMFEKCTETLNEKIAMESYTYEKLLVDIAKMRKMFLQKFKGHSQVTERVFPQLSQQLYRKFDEFHPKANAPDINEIAKQYGDQ
ncbi:Guanylate-binding protein N-terminal domain family protein [Babesia bovis T2Bo]|uniref:Uncharacterized protein n=1 Tax=Babesia bovis TaxID=5865 RepID=A7AX60_BABBO|nr:Guanylate-binding protein N-terminal domain family protein [Babesia bovis T2Bo]EDO05133.1 Guanylate-binding protein N-terminal domain family protein [Babesia bovis T2Bo]|eukprot:XP_001608701.1 hypothetical protein [Babesia bovis T2Bo]